MKNIPEICFRCGWYEPDYSHCPWCGHHRVLLQIQRTITAFALVKIITATALLSLFLPVATSFLYILTIWGIFLATSAAILWARRQRKTLNTKYRCLNGILVRLERDYPINVYIPDTASIIYMHHWQKTKKELLLIEYEIWANQLFVAIKNHQPLTSLQEEGRKLLLQHQQHAPHADYLDILNEQVNFAY